MRMKVLEAMALGKAVVTTSRGAEGLESVRIPPLVVADTAEEIASATSRLLSDAGERRILGEEARAFVVEHHSPRAFASRLEHAYEEAQARFLAHRRSQDDGS
jgi:glycosyltransferase involved in cell wall biosynthesis